MTNSISTPVKLSDRDIRKVIRAYASVNVLNLAREAFVMGQGPSRNRVIAVFAISLLLMVGGLFLFQFASTAVSFLVATFALWNVFEVLDLIRKQHRALLITLGDLEDQPIRVGQGWLSDLKYALFVQRIPLHVREPQNLARLLHHLAREVESTQSSLAAHPLVIAVITFTLAIIGGISSRDDTSLPFWAAVIALNVMGLVLLSQFPDLLMSKHNRNRQLLRFAEKLELEEDPVQP